MSQAEDIEYFLKRVNAKGSFFSDDKIALSAMAMRGQNPCDFCKNKKQKVGEDEEFCQNVTCLAYYRWFQYRWHKLQKAAFGEKRKNK
ncbi:MAG: hypothetical protein IKW45_05390 [Clostridia bacterium]|nr:hypothetical protein [Clostridia bacterium]